MVEWSNADLKDEYEWSNNNTSPNGIGRCVPLELVVNPITK
jgi:hypothetical protein